MTPPTTESAIPPTTDLKDAKATVPKERKYLNQGDTGKKSPGIAPKSPANQSKPPSSALAGTKPPSPALAGTKPPSPALPGEKIPAPTFPGSRKPAPVPEPLDHAKLRKLAEESPYKLGGMMAKGAESVLYLGDFEGNELCVKAIRNKLNHWIGDSVTKKQEERLENVPYHTKKRHILNEFNTARALYSDGELPIVHIYALRKVSTLGMEVGYDLIMEALHGHDLSDRMVARNLSFEDKLKVMVQTVNALAYVHQHKFIHLDIKPSNYILVNGQVKLIDFGVTVMNGYRPTAVTGTGGFLSPEQICKEILDESSDIFALGVTLAVFFGGKSLNQPQESLLKSKTWQEAKYRLEHEDQPQVIEIPELAPYPELAQILRNCTIPRRDLRIKSCTALLSHLRRWAADHPDISEGMFDR
ncbi:MAG: protein kinase [Victivallales bacterium]|nr:protein kinase [Victivallales bacterium]